MSIEVLENVICDFFFQAEDGKRDPLWSRGLGDVYKRQSRKFAHQYLQNNTDVVIYWVRLKQPLLNP